MAKTEHFVTLFDSAFLPMGLTLYRSLERHAQPFLLWTLCMDDESAVALERLALPHLQVIRLKEIETPELLAAKRNRRWGEYCWTLSSFTFDAVFDRAPSAQRVTYLDADMQFFADPRELLAEMPPEKQVLITEHAYAPEYDQTQRSGRFCVQFVTFDRTDEAQRVRQWWQERVLEECSSTPGKLGDQGYLDEWPRLFGEVLHIVEQKHRTLAPWNSNHFQRLEPQTTPVFFHFHGLRIVRSDRVRLYAGYYVGPEADQRYDSYIAALVQSVAELASLGVTVRPLPVPSRWWNCIGSQVRIWCGRERYARLQVRQDQPVRTGVD
jgi:hypothetical protein